MFSPSPPVDLYQVKRSTKTIDELTDQLSSLFCKQINM